MKPNELTRALNPAALFNAFLNRVVTNGSVSAEHRRVRSRQPENEVFVRKALVAVQKLAPEVQIKSTATELTAGHQVHGRDALSAGAEQLLSSKSEMARYLGLPGHERPTLRPIELFSLLQMHAFSAISRSMTATPLFGSSAGLIGVGMSAQATKLDPRIRGAADSVFAQSFADVHAVKMVAIADGSDAALELLNEVYRRRESAGDFGKFSTLPLSQDSCAALEIMRSELGAGKDFAAMAREERWGHSLWVAAEGLGVWMLKNGASPDAATAVTNAIESMGQVLAVASSRMPGHVKTVNKPS